MPTYCRRRFSGLGWPGSGRWRSNPRGNLRLQQNIVTGKAWPLPVPYSTAAVKSWGGGCESWALLTHRPEQHRKSTIKLQGSLVLATWGWQGLNVSVMGHIWTYVFLISHTVSFSRDFFNVWYKCVSTTCMHGGQRGQKRASDLECCEPPCGC